MDTILTRRSPDFVRVPTASVTLRYDQRRRCRQRIVLDDGTEAAVMMDPGTTLHAGDVLADETGEVRVCIRAAEEHLSRATTVDPLLLARACYHLGNRHIALEIREGAVYYQHDHVLDDMVRGIGLEVSRLLRAFQPEHGAYAHTH